MTYILSNGTESVHVDDRAMLAMAAKLAGDASRPVAIWQHFGMGAPRVLVNVAGFALPDPLPPLDAPAIDAAPATAVEPIACVNASTFPPTEDGAPPSRPTEPAPAPAFSTFSDLIVDPEAKARIDAQQNALRSAGFKGIGHKASGGDGEQFFTNGTRMGADGYAKQASGKAEHDAKISAHDAADMLARTVASEQRVDQIVSAAEIGRGIAVNGKITALGYALGEHAIRGLLTRLDSPSLGYVLGLRDRIAAGVAQASVQGAPRADILAIVGEDKAKIAEILSYECSRPAAADVRLTMRLRDATRDCYAVLGPAYSPADAPAAIAEILPELPRDAKGSWSYDPSTTAWELRADVWTPTPTAKQAVGEAFSGHVSFTSRDNGTSRFRGGGGIVLLRCLNASTYVADGTDVARVHRGRVLTDVAAMMAGSLAAIDALCAAWGQARAAEIEVPGGVPIEVAIPGFWRSLLTSDRELVGVLPGKKEEHVKSLSAAYFGERRDPSKVVRADLAQGWTRYIQDQPTDVRRDAEAAIGSWVVSDRRVGFKPSRSG